MKIIFLPYILFFILIFSSTLSMAENEISFSYGKTKASEYPRAISFKHLVPFSGTNQLYNELFISKFKSNTLGFNYIGLRNNFWTNWGLDTAFGIGVVKNINDRLSSRAEMSQNISLFYKNIFFSYSHFSNGGLKQPNNGEDIAMVGLQFSF